MSYTPCLEKGATVFLPLTFQMLTDFQNSLTGRFSSKFLARD